MSAERGCDQVRGLLPELALGIAEGDERARALDHLADCPACRRRLEELSSLADEVLLLVPAEEPPAGFETRVLDQLEASRPRRRSLALRILAPACAAAVAVAVTLGVAHRDDRDLASRYRATLAEVDGKYLAGERLYGPGEAEVGKVYGYEGDPSWVLVSVDGDVPAGRHGLELVTREGERLALRPLAVREGEGSLGQAIPIHFSDVAQVRLLGRGPGVVYQAGFED